MIIGASQAIHPPSLAADYGQEGNKFSLFRSQEHPNQIYLPPIRVAIPEINANRPVSTSSKPPVGVASPAQHMTRSSPQSPYTLYTYAYQFPGKLRRYSDDEPDVDYNTPRMYPSPPMTSTGREDYNNSNNAFAFEREENYPRYANVATQQRYHEQAAMHMGNHPGAYDQAYGSYDRQYDMSKQRKRRGNLPKETTDQLRAWFAAHLDHPYPSESEKVALMRRTGLQMNQISNWFINARRRQLPAMMHKRRLENEARHGSVSSSEEDSKL